MSGEHGTEFIQIGLDAARFKSSGAAKTEWHGPCPFCGGNDRFCIFTDRAFPSWNWWCRHCGKSGWADQINPRLKVEVNKDARDEWEKQAKQKREQAEARRRAALAKFSTEELWSELHRRMSEANRAWWDAQGVPEYLQDFYQLGFVAQRSFEHDGAFFSRDAYTIPKFGPNYKPLNMDYRIVNPPPGVGKYRPAPGLPAAYFLSRPDYTQMPDELYIVEGSKKAIIFCQYLDQRRQVIGVPSCNSWAGADAAAHSCGRAWIMLDPDAPQWARKLASAIGPHARIVTLPHKPDDMILAGAREQEFQRLFHYARKP